MLEKEQRQDRVKVEVGPAPIDCSIDGHFDRRIMGVGVRVIFDGENIWEEREYPRFISDILGYPPKPRYDARVERAKKKANRIAEKLSASL